MPLNIFPNTCTSTLSDTNCELFCVLLIVTLYAAFMASVSTLLVLPSTDINHASMIIDIPNTPVIIVGCAIICISAHQFRLPTYHPTDRSSSPSIDTSSFLRTQSAKLSGIRAINIHILTIRTMLISMSMISITAYPSATISCIVNHVSIVLRSSLLVFAVLSAVND